MTYFTFLGWYVGIPLLFLTLLAWWDSRHGLRLPATLHSWPFGIVMVIHVIVAVLYTTPWDNYLVATGVWWYNPALVTNIVIGWVPIEEYTFFIVQTIFTSLWLLAVARRSLDQSDRTQEQRNVIAATRQSSSAPRALRFNLALAIGLIWIGAIVLLVSGWQSGTYLALELAWALPPIIFQLGFGADILWHYRRIVCWSLLIPTLYLAITDTIAIGAGTWTIDPAQSTGLLIGSLPIEEFIFFLVTNLLVVFGTILVLAKASHERVPQALRRHLQPPSQQKQMITAGQVRQ